METTGTPMRRFLVLVAVCAVLLAACSSGSDDSGSDTTGSSDDSAEQTGSDTGGDTTSGDSDGGDEIDKCTLLEASEIEAEFGGPVSNPIDEGYQCQWEVGEDQSQPGTGTISVAAGTQVPDQSGQDYYDIVREAATDAVEVDGIGDAAYYEPVFGAVTVLANDTVIVVQAAFIPEPDGQQEKVENLAALVADRL